MVVMLDKREHWVHKMLIHHVENRTDIKHVEENSEMRQIGLASKELAIFTWF